MTPPRRHHPQDAEITHEAATDYNDEGAGANDDTDGDLSSEIVVVGDDFDTKEIGVFEIVYNATMPGNKAGGARRLQSRIQQSRACPPR